jgi:hypothetical protein
MYNHVSTLGQCVQPYLTGMDHISSFCLLKHHFIAYPLISRYLSVPTQSCSDSSDCNDGISCTDDVCVAGSCTNTMRDDCCGK